jgi:hypothetical protein
MGKLQPIALSDGNTRSAVWGRGIPKNKTKNKKQNINLHKKLTTIMRRKKNLQVRLRDSSTQGKTITPQNQQRQ